MYKKKQKLRAQNILKIYVEKNKRICQLFNVHKELNFGFTEQTGKYLQQL